MQFSPRLHVLKIINFELLLDEKGVTKMPTVSLSVSFPVTRRISTANFFPLALFLKMCDLVSSLKAGVLCQRTTFTHALQN